MTKNFEQKVTYYGSVDTRNYRYIYVIRNEAAYIKRLQLELLDTTAAIDGWETVKIYK